MNSFGLGKPVNSFGLGLAYAGEPAPEPPVEEVKRGGGGSSQYPGRYKDYLYPIQEKDEHFNQDDKDIVEILQFIAMTGILDGESN